VLLNKETDRTILHLPTKLYYLPPSEKKSPVISSILCIQATWLHESNYCKTCHCKSRIM